MRDTITLRVIQKARIYVETVVEARTVTRSAGDVRVLLPHLLSRGSGTDSRSNRALHLSDRLSAEAT